ncbi:hypothetical protein LEP3755_30600 [Leptolyngbya sp. NIES-3755]|nr:hypothetical protein LEP3755_30600 [Leptolyngbya sp. NIES-3755]
MYINSKHCETRSYAPRFGAWKLIFTEPKTKTEITIGVYHNQKTLQEAAAWIDHCVHLLSVRDWINLVSENPLPFRKAMCGFLILLPKCECQGKQTDEGKPIHLHFLKAPVKTSDSTDV